MTADQVRAAMPADMLAACDALKARFGARLLHVETENFAVGRDPCPEFDAVECRRECERDKGPVVSQEGVGR
jgi:hypothetical protein